MVFLLGLITTSCLSQVQFQGNFTVGKHARSKGFALSYIGVGLGRMRGAMYNNARSALIIDVDALRNPGRTYTYRQLSERMYGFWPGFASMATQTIPYFLVSEPPVTPRFAPVVRVRRSQSYLER